MNAFLDGFYKRAEVSKSDLKEVLKKHEDRETPEQEAAESEREQKVEREAGVEKKAFWQGFKTAAEQGTAANPEILTATQAPLKKAKHVGSTGPVVKRKLLPGPAGKIGKAVNYGPLVKNRLISGGVGLVTGLGLGAIGHHIYSKSTKDKTKKEDGQVSA